MYQTYKGVVRNGRPVIAETAKLPENAEFFITFLDETFDIEGAEKELIQKLAEAAEYSDAECEDWDSFYERFRIVQNERV